MGGETELLEQGGRIARDVGTRAVQESGGFFGSLISSPFRLLGTLGRSVWNGLVHYGLPIAGITGAAMAFAPDLVRGAGELTGRTDLSDAAGRSVREGNIPQAALLALGAGAIGGGAIGAASGLLQSVTGGGSEAEAPRSTGAQLGTAIGSIVTFGAIAAVGLGALRNSGVSHDAGAGEAVRPPVVPAANQAESQRAAH